MEALIGLGVSEEMFEIVNDDNNDDNDGRLSKGIL